MKKVIGVALLPISRGCLENIMFIKDVSAKRKTIAVAIPLTMGTEKTRIKKRNILNEYGLPVATKREPFSQQCYVEWQIGYDALTTDIDRLSKTTLMDKTFTGSNGKSKALYELSEYIYHFYQWGVIVREKLEDIKNFITGIEHKHLLDVNKDYVIDRSHPIPQKIFDIYFEYTQVKYPLLIHKYPPFEVFTEIKISEKQYAVGVQPMLYFCFPITELKTDVPLLGRVAKTKEFAEFEINTSNINVFLETLKIFGILSKNHNLDVISIIDVILNK